MDLAAQSSIALNFSLLLQLICLAAVICVDKYIKKDKRMILFKNVGLIFSVVFASQIETYLQLTGISVFARILTSMYCYIGRPIIIVLFIRLLSDDKKPWILAIINLMIYSTALYSGIAFTISKDNFFVRGPLGYSCHIISGILIVWLVWVALKKFKDERKLINFIPVMIALIITICVLVDISGMFNASVSFQTVALITGCLFFYIWLHLQFVREHDKALEDETKIEIMMSQIQPHFMYNTLSTIQALCLTDPKKAFTTAEKFGTYLRNNIGSLNKNSLIPFNQEFEHTRVYSEIEMIRFPNIRIDYDIEDDDFELPALTLQPIVENAIRHGVRIRKTGSIWITVKTEDGFHVITVRDNGKGFDVEKLKASGEEHFGLKTIKTRLENLCGGDLSVESTIDVGTMVTVKVPCGEHNNESDLR
ncbi:sensor histidine kinase [Butyrivibrio sp. XPD2002]|uniref:sensor histidine kinase n=1 Tax=Butyrivibrio sp. XPD2002 TaxID=1280665 RepID=UPI0003F72E2D|nr:histidine kinase [Butyrivibrio sp. XPD2002]